MKAFPRFAIYLLIKWILFYAYQFLEGSSNWNFRKANGEGIFLAAFMLLALPLLELIVLFFPVQLALRNKGFIAVLLLLLTFGLEFMIGWFTTSQSLETWMIVKMILSVILFGIFYRKLLAIT